MQPSRGGAANRLPLTAYRLAVPAPSGAPGHCVRNPNAKENRLEPVRPAETNLFGQGVIGEDGNGRAVSHKVRHRLHDIPGIFPPGESRQGSELDAHQTQSHPRQHVGSLLRISHQLALLLQWHNRHQTSR